MLTWPGLALRILGTLPGLLKNDLRADIALLQNTQPATYKALREASQVDDAGYRKRQGKRGKSIKDPTDTPGENTSLT